jgi:Domain of unknown function (DUF4177)
MAYEYKCVSGPTIVAVKSTKARDQAVKAFEDIMNAEAEHGWEFVGIDEFHVSEPQGLFSKKRIYVPAKILVFRREKAGSLLADALKARNAKLDSERPAPEAESKTSANPLSVGDLLLEKPMQMVTEGVEETKKISLQSIVSRIKGKTS